MIMLEKHLAPISRRLSTSLPKPNSILSFTQTSPPLEHLVGRLQSLLQSCSDPSDLRKGRQAHAQAILNGFGDVDCLQNRILGMYVLCRSFSDAKDAFFRMERRAPLPWNWMIRGFSMMGRFEFVLLMYFKMWFSGVVPDKYTFPHVVKACGGLAAVGLGRMVHETVCLLGFEMDVFVGSSLIKMYSEIGSIHDARELFDRMPHKDCVLWNVMIDVYMRGRYVQEAVGMFKRMRYSELKPNYVSFTSVLSICASQAKLDYGVQLHGLAIRSGVDFESPVANTLLAMYSKCRCWFDMCKLFDTMPHVELVAWNGMISGYVQNDLLKEALDSFHEMQSSGVKPDSVTLTSILPAFSASAGLNQGKEIHAYVVRNEVHMDAFLKSSLINVYFKCRHVEMARKIFDGTETMDVVICSAMISGYVLNGKSSNALEMFRLLLQTQLKLNAVIIASVLPACSFLGTLSLGKELHCYSIKNEFDGRCYVGSALTDMYSKCGRLDLGNYIFKKISEKDVVSWNSMISSFTQNAQPEEAISLFRQMGVEGIAYDGVSISSALSACANLPALHYGKEIHCFMTRGALKLDLFAESALIDMYGKCGKLVLAQRVFDLMQNANEVSWNSIIAAHAVHGHVKDAGILFENMQKSGFIPDQVTFLSILSACSHGGQIEEGFRYFRRMSEEYGIQPQTEHYACMVDIFGRTGLLHEALSFINNMPIEPDAGIWGALLGACRVHHNVELAELASTYLFKLDPKNSGYYVLLSNIHAVTGEWEGARKVRSLMKERKVQKSPGCSWIYINNANHIFVADDESHPDSAEIYSYLDSLRLELREEGYIPKPDFLYPLSIGLLQAGIG